MFLLLYRDKVSSKSVVPSLGAAIRDKMGLSIAKPSDVASESWEGREENGLMQMGLWVLNSTKFPLRSLTVFSKERPTSKTKTRPPIPNILVMSSCIKTDFPEPNRPTTQVL